MNLLPETLRNRIEIAGDCWELTGRTFRTCKACAELHTSRYRSKQLGKPIAQFYGEAAA